MDEQQRAERAAREGKLFRLLVENVVDYAIYVVDPLGLVQTWSHGAERLLGYTEQEILGRTSDLFFTPEDVRDDVPQHEIRQALAIGRGVDDRWQVRKDGTRFWVSGVMTPLWEPGGKLQGLAKIMRNRTDWWVADQARQAGEGRHRAILESITDAFFALDRDWRFTYVNRQAEQLVSRTQSDLLGKDFWVEFPGVAGTEFEGLHRRAMDDGIAASVTAFYPDHDRWYDVHAYPAKDGLSIYFRDVTDRKRQEEENQELMAAADRQRRTYETALSSTPDFNYIFDMQGRLTYVNASLLDLWQVGLDDALGKDFFELGYPTDLADRLQRQIRQVIQFKAPVRDETGFTSHLGERIYEYILVPVLGADGDVEAVAGSTRDITERRRHEEAWRLAKDEAERANKAKDHFLAVLSHELRTPLNPILLAVSSMLDRMPEPEEVRPTLEMIRQNVKLQARLIDDLLDVMRIVQGKMPLHWGVSDCHALIAQSVEICRSEFQGKGQKLELDLRAKDHHVNADSARLHQVLWNLLRNAVKFTPEGGSLFVRTRNEGPDQQDIVIEVADTGIGIAPEVLPTIFDPFQQGETTITRRFGGLGLGLAICKGVVDAHGGTMVVESPGSDRGTTFRVVLKTVAEPAVQTTNAGDSEVQLPQLRNRLNILLVEDEAGTLRLMTRLLKGLGHRVTAAGTVAQAWADFLSVEFDLIVSDIGLPDGTGHDLMRRVKAVRPVPAVALTGYGMDEDVRRSREAGFTIHMTKPIDFIRLEAIIRQVAN